NRERWPLLAPLLADPALKPGPPEIEAAYRHFLEVLAIRRSTPLLRLPSRQDVLRRLSFLRPRSGPLPGLVAFQVVDPEGALGGLGALDPLRDRVVVLLNAND